MFDIQWADNWKQVSVQCFETLICGHFVQRFHLCSALKLKKHVQFHKLALWSFGQLGVTALLHVEATEHNFELEIFSDFHLGPTLHRVQN